ncbi:MAG: glycoside hydrolase family 25 protein [Flavobacterium sp.]
MKKPIARKKAAVKRKPRAKKKEPFFSGNRLRFSLIAFFILLLLAAGYHYSNGLAYYFSFKSDKTLKEKAESKRISDVRNYQVLQKHEGKVVGFDVSEFQGKIDWTLVDTIEEDYPLQFVFIRATAGNNKVDTQFKRNWRGAKRKNIIRGAYHYYRPNENSLEQAELFIKTVQLKKGDLPPVLDIEKLPKNQSIDSLKVGLRRWLKRIDKHYNVKPIIYSGESYYNDFLKDEFSEYPFWIANYNFFVEEIGENWLFWQFTEKGTVPGIKGSVDINIYNGTPKQLGYRTMN